MTKTDLQSPALTDNSDLKGQALGTGSARPPTFEEISRTSLAVVLKADSRQLDLMDEPSRVLACKLLHQTIQFIENHENGFVVEFANHARQMQSQVIKQHLFTNAIVGCMRLPAFNSKPLSEQPHVLEFEKAILGNLENLSLRISSNSAPELFRVDKDRVLQLAEHILTVYDKKVGSFAYEVERKRRPLDKVAESYIEFRKCLEVDQSFGLSGNEKNVLSSYFIYSNISSLAIFENVGTKESFERFSKRLALLKIDPREFLISEVLKGFEINQKSNPLGLGSFLQRFDADTSEKLTELSDAYYAILKISERQRLHAHAEVVYAGLWKLFCNSVYEVDIRNKNPYPIAFQCMTKDTDLWCSKTHQEIGSYVPEAGILRSRLSPFAAPRILDLMYVTDCKTIEVYGSLPFKASESPWSADLDELRLRWSWGKTETRHWDPGILAAVGSAEILLAWELKGIGADPEKIHFTPDPEIDGAYICKIEFSRESSGFRYMRSIRYIPRELQVPASLTALNIERPFGLVYDRLDFPPVLSIWFESETFKSIEGYKRLKSDSRASIHVREKSIEQLDREIALTAVTPPLDRTSPEPAVESSTPKVAIEKNAQPAEPQITELSPIVDAVTSSGPAMSENSQNTTALGDLSEHHEEPALVAEITVVAPAPSKVIRVAKPKDKKAAPPPAKVYPAPPEEIRAAAREIVKGALTHSMFEGTLKDVRSQLMSLSNGHTPSKSQIRPLLRIGSTLERSRSSNLLIMGIHEKVSELNVSLCEFYGELDEQENRAQGSASV